VPGQVVVTREPGAASAARPIGLCKLALEVEHDVKRALRRFNGSPLDPRSISQAFQVRRKAAGLPASTLHGLRHAAATMLALHVGAHPETTRAVLGHASTATTAQYYLHAVDDLTAATVASLADLVDGVR
jgi:integrase